MVFHVKIVIFFYLLSVRISNVTAVPYGYLKAISFIQFNKKFLKRIGIRNAKAHNLQRSKHNLGKKRSKQKAKKYSPSTIIL
jgi:hypothetical protein